ncbi:MAG: hypothetical protein ACMUIA_03785 [bacterium]
MYHSKAEGISDGTFLAALGRYGQEHGQFDCPSDIAGDGRGHIYVADSGNGRIRIIAMQFNEIFAL